MADQALFNVLRAWDANGYAAPNATITFYASGTLTEIDVWTDSTESTLRTNPVVSDGNGVFPQCWVAETARGILRDEDGVILADIDPVPSISAAFGAAAQISFEPSVNVAATNVQDAINVVDTNARAREAVISAAKQPLDADLTAIAALSRTRGDLIRGGASAWERVALGTTGRVVRSNGTDVTWDDATKLSASQSASGVVVNFTGIPSWANVIQVNLSGVSLSGTDDLLVQLGTASAHVNTGYGGGANFLGAGNAGTASSAGFMVRLASAARAATGIVNITRLTDDTWIASHACAVSSTGECSIGGGSLALGDTLTRLRVVPTGSDTFDAGTISVTWF